jgi:drug/metabolite transporter (DMT)-like permease
MSNSALFLTASLVWGSTWYAITFQLGAVAPEVAVAQRFALAAIAFGLWCRATGRPLAFSPRQHAAIAAQGALLFGLNYIAVYWAESYVASGLVAVLFSTIVLFNPLLARLFFGTPLTARALVGGAIGVAGVALLFAPEIVALANGGDPALGIAFGLAATLIASGGNMLAVRNQRAGIPIFQGIAWGMAYGAGVAALVALLHGAAFTFSATLPYVASLAYLALFGSIVAFGAYLTLVARVGAGPAAYVNVATPVVAMALSTLLEGYRWTWPAAAGVILALAGNVLVTRSGRAAAPAVAPRR